MSQPLYRQVQAALADRIATMQVGDVLPSEPELEREFGVSRITVRRAVENLVQEGVLAKRQGFGTLVREPTSTQDVGRIYSWSHEMRRRHVEASSRLLSLTLRDAPAQVAEELELGPDERVVEMTRVRLVKGSPIALMVNYLRERYVPGLVERGLPGESLYDELTERYGLELATGTETIRARNATDVEASLLATEPGAALLSVRRRTCLRGDVPFEVVEMAARGDKYEYLAQLDGGARTRREPE